MTPVSFWVPGTPVPQGSKRAFVNKSTGRPVITDADVRLPEWRMKITAHALTAIQHHTRALDYPLDGPVGCRIDFIIQRPMSHYGTGRNHDTLKPSSPKYPARMPDLDKLLRAVFDGITDAQVWRDDGQVVWVQTTKTYGAKPGVTITLGAMK